MISNSMPPPSEMESTPGIRLSGLLTTQKKPDNFSGSLNLISIHAYRKVWRDALETLSRSDWLVFVQYISNFTKHFRFSLL